MVTKDVLGKCFPNKFVNDMISLHYRVILLGERSGLFVFLSTTYVGMAWACLPADIVYCILPYTYSPQPAALLEDIRDFRHSKARAGAYFYETFVVGWH